MNQRHCRQPGRRGRFLYWRGAVNGSGRAAACHRRFLSVAAALWNGRSCGGHIGVSRSPVGGLFFSLYHRMHQRCRSQPGLRADCRRGGFLYRDWGRPGGSRGGLPAGPVLRGGRGRGGHIGVERPLVGGLFFSLYRRMYQRSRSQAGRRTGRDRGRTIISPERHFSLVGVLRCGQSPGHHGPAGHGAVFGHFLPGSGCRMYQRGRPYPGSIHGGAGNGCIPGFRLRGNRSCCFFGLCRAAAGQRVAKIGGTVIFLSC